MEKYNQVYKNIKGAYEKVKSGISSIGNLEKKTQRVGAGLIGLSMLGGCASIPLEVDLSCQQSPVVCGLKFREEHPNVVICIGEYNGKVGGLHAQAAIKDETGLIWIQIKKDFQQCRAGENLTELKSVKDYFTIEQFISKYEP